MKMIAMILAGGTGSELSVLTYFRAKTALPFGGRYRIIDFSLSNCVHSGIRNIAVLAQYSPRSLIDHIGLGKPWDLDTKTGGVFILQPTHYGRVAKWYRGTADAIYQNIDMIMNSKAKLVLVLSGDHVYRMDYRKMAEEHFRSGKPLTIALKKVRKGHRSRFGMARCDSSCSVTAFEEKPKSSNYDMVSMGIYLFNRDYLIKLLNGSKVDIVFDILIPMVNAGKVNGYVFEGYWEDIGSISSYYDASMKLIKRGSLLFDKNWPIYTRGTESPPAKFIEGSRVADSIIASGCLVEGRVEGSILFPGVTVARNAVVKNSIVFSYSDIGADSVVEGSILDKFVTVRRRAVIGKASSRLSHYRKASAGKKAKSRITVIGRNAVVKGNTVIHRGVIVEPRSTVKGELNG